MIGYLPTIYPDELVYSWFCRYYVHSGYLSHKMAMEDLFCKRSDNPSKEFIGHLNHEAKQVISSMYSMGKLVLDHTMFPQYARFIPLAKRKVAFDTLQKEAVDVHHLFCVLPRGVGEEYLKYCPLCATEDREKYGETYWHRKHQIRGIDICTKHKCKLKDSEVTAKSQNTFSFCPAENYIVDIEPELINDPVKIGYAEFMERVFDSPIDFERDIPVKAVLYHGMKPTEYMKSTGRCRHTTKLANDMAKFFSLVGVQNVASLHQITRTILGDRFDFSIVCQIAFFVGISVEELVNSQIIEEEIRQEEAIHFAKDLMVSDWNEYDSEMLPLFEETAKAIYDGVLNENGRPERVGVKTICKALNISEHRIENMPKCKAVLDKYKESYGENYARRIVWAYDKLKHENPDSKVYWSDIRLIAGVKKHNYDKAVPYLIKYAEKEEIESIRKMVKCQ